MAGGLERERVKKKNQYLYKNNKNNIIKINRTFVTGYAIGYDKFITDTDNFNFFLKNFGWRFME